MNKKDTDMDIVLVLHNIRSVHNVGSLFRTADGAGVGKVILTGYTPTPIDRFGRERKDLAKVALGAEKSVSWSHVGTLREAVESLCKEEYTIVLVEQDERSVSLFEWKPPADAKLAIVLGPEVGGFSPEERALADVIVEIPMRGTKESLNVSVAGGIALYVLLSTNKSG